MKKTKKSLRKKKTPETIVVKFGGKALGRNSKDVERLNMVADFLAGLHRQGKRIVVALSAMAKRTDELIALAKNLNATPKGPALDGLVQLGEMESVFLLGLALQKRGLSTQCFNSQQIGIRVRGKFSSARIEKIERPKIISRALDEGSVVIVPGFQGMTEDGFIATLGRGGSDLTAVAIAIAIRAKTVIFFKDVDGIYAGDPHIISRVRRFDRLSYQTTFGIIQEGGERGTLMNRCVVMAAEHGITLVVRISPSIGKTTGGTTIGAVSSLDDMEAELTNVAAIMCKEVARIRVARVPDKPGALELIDEALSTFVGVKQIQDQGRQGVASVAYLVKPEDLPTILNRIRALDDLKVEGEAGLVAITLKDPAMREAPGYLARRSRALHKAGVNIRMVFTAHDAITTVVDKQDLRKAANALAREFGLVEK